MDVMNIEIKEDIFTISTPVAETEKKHAKKSFWHIDKNMIRFKLHFFLYIGAMGATLPYFPIVARNRIGMSATSLAAVLTAQQFLTVLSKPLIGYIVDYFNKLKLMIILLIVVQTVFYFLILAIPPIKKQQTESLAINLSPENFSIWDQTTVYVLLKSELNCGNEERINSSKITSRSHLAASGNKSIHDVICFVHFTANTLQCYKSTMEDEIENSDSIGSDYYCCSVYSSYSDINMNISDWNTYKIQLQISSLQPEITQESINKSFPCSMALDKKDLSVNQEESQFMSDIQTLEFWVFALTYSVASTCTSSGFTLGDTACCESIQKFGGDFGRQRLYGAVGWGTLATIGGLLCDVTNDYIAAWILMAVLQAVTVWNISKIDLVKPHFSQSVAKDVGTVLNSVEFLTFQLGVFMSGMGAGIMWFYLIWFLTSLGGSTFLCGLVQYIQCFIGEIPFMFFSTWFINKIGHFNLITLCLMCYATRFLWYSYLQNPWFVLPVEIMHSFTYGTFYPAVASFGKLKAKPGTEATTQSILFTTHEGLGAGMGCVLAGVGFDNLGGHITFFYTSMFGFLAVAINIFNTFLNRRKMKTFMVSPSTK